MTGEVARILLLRSSDEATDARPGVDVLVTHAIAPAPEGLAEAAGFPAEGATLVVSSRTTLRVLQEAGKGALFTAPFAAVHAVGGETGRALEKAGARGVRVSDVPGARGVLAALPERLDGARILWPRGSDADAAPFAELARRGAVVAAPVVYEKKPRKLEPETLQRLRAGEYAGVAVSSLAALDVLLESLAALPSVRWGVIGPDSARHFRARGLPVPVVPARPSLDDLIESLKQAIHSAPLARPVTSPDGESR